MKNKKANGKTATIILVLLLVGAFAIADLDTSDIDALQNCNVTSSTLKRNTTSWYCDTTHYAEGYYHNYSNPNIVTISTANTSYNITGWIQGDTEGITFSGNGVNIQKTATYRLIGSVSFTGGNNGRYEIVLNNNEVKLPHCATYRSTSSNAIGNIAFSCIEELSTGDHLTIKVEDFEAPAQDISIYITNFNIMEIK